MTVKYITIAKFALASGYSEKAIRRKIEEGVWLENRHYRRAPDGHILIDAAQVAEDEALAKEPVWDDRRQRFKVAYAVQAKIAAPTCGVYLLLLEGEIAYVGRSTSLRSRLATHRASGRQFDEARVIPCDAERAEWLEKELIRTLKPTQNLLRYLRHSTHPEAALMLEGL